MALVESTFEDDEVDLVVGLAQNIGLMDIFIQPRSLPRVSNLQKLKIFGLIREIYAVKRYLAPVSFR